jgi:hypothetical protein
VHGRARRLDGAAVAGVPVTFTVTIRTMSSVQIELAEGTRSDLATLLRDAVAATLERYPERAQSVDAMNDHVLVRAEDTGEAVTLSFAQSRLRIADGEATPVKIRILGDRDTIAALTRLPLRHGLPDLRSETGRAVLLHQLSGELTVRGLLLRLPQIRHLLQVLAGG